MKDDEEDSEEDDDVDKEEDGFIINIRNAICKT